MSFLLIREFASLKQTSLEGTTYLSRIVHHSEDIPEILLLI